MKTVQMFYDFYAWKTEETTKVMKDMIKKKKKKIMHPKLPLPFFVCFWTLPQRYRSLTLFAKITFANANVIRNNGMENRVILSPNKVLFK